MEAQGKVEFIQAGAARYIRRCKRVPATFLMEFTSEPLLLFSSDLILIDASKNADQFRTTVESPNNGGSIPNFLTDEIIQGLADAIAGITSTFAQCPELNTRTAVATVQTIPVVFDEGSPGAGLRIHLHEQTGQEKNTAHSPQGFHEDFFHNNTPFNAYISRDMSILSMNSTYADHIRHENSLDVMPVFIPEYPHDEYLSVVSRIRAISEMNPEIELDMKRITPQGELSFEHWTIRGIFSDDGNLVRYLAAGLETTRYRRVEQDLIIANNQLETRMDMRTTELKLINKELHKEIQRRSAAEKELALSRYAVENAYDLIFLLNTDGEVFYTNIRGQELAGSDSAPVIGRNISDLITFLSEENGEYIPSSPAALQNACPVSCEGILHIPDEKTAYIELTISQITMQGGSFYCVIAHDISERKHIEEALKKSEELFRLLAENSGDLIWLMDTKTERFLYVSPSSHDIIGFSPDEMQNLSWGDLIPKEDYLKAREYLDNRCSHLTSDDLSSRVIRQRTRMIRKSGTVAYIESVSTLLQKNPHISLALEISREVSLQEQNKKESEILQDISFWPRI